MEVIRGIAASPGIVVGKALLLGAAETHVPRRTIAQPKVEAEQARFRQAVSQAIADLGELRRTTESQLGAETAKIFAFHEGLLQDPTLLQPILDMVEGSIAGYEALTRGPSDSPLHSPEALFKVGYGRLLDLDLACSNMAFATFARLKLPGRLFVNLTPGSLLAAIAIPTPVQHSRMPRSTLPSLTRRATSAAMSG